MSYKSNGLMHSELIYRYHCGLELISHTILCSQHTPKIPKQNLGNIVKLDDNTSAEWKTGIKNTSILIKEGDGQLLLGDIDCMLKEN